MDFPPIEVSGQIRPLQYDARKVTVAAYNEAKTDPPEGMDKQIRSRVKVKAAPVPVQLFEIPKPADL